MLKKALQVSWYWIARWACRVFCIIFFRFRAYGRENVPDKGPFILVANHQSYLDPIFCGVGLKRQLYFLARDSLFANRYFSWLISSLNAIPIKRNQADLSSTKAVISKLKNGSGICLFPEATRTRDGKIAPFKAGFGVLAKRAEAIIVPVLIDGAFACWPRHKKIFSPGWVTVHYGKAIAVNQLKNSSSKELARFLTQRLRQMQIDWAMKQGKKPYNYQNNDS